MKARAWWPKPTWASMLQTADTTVAADGTPMYTFNISASSHPNDINADDYIVLLVGAGHQPDPNDMEVSRAAALAQVRMSGE